MSIRSREFYEKRQERGEKRDGLKMRMVEYEYGRMMRTDREISIRESEIVDRSVTKGKERRRKRGRSADKSQ